MARIDPRVHPLAAFGVALFGGEKLQFGFQAEKCGLRKAVGEVKGDVLNHVGAFKMRQISAAMPPGSAILLNGVVDGAGGR